MVNFTGVIKIGEDYINTQSVNNWGNDDEYGTRIECRDTDVRFFEGFSAEDFYEKFQEAEKTGFSIIA